MAHFAVIVPLYNKAPYIWKALESIFSQTCTDWELVIVDDGSRDRSGDIAGECISVFGEAEKCKLLRQENAGVGTARNNGVAASTGEYICFLDADDWWDEHFLERMDGLIREYPDAGIYGTNYFYVKNGKSRPSAVAVDAGFHSGYINYCEVYSRHLCQPLWTGAVCVPRQVFDRNGGFKANLRLGEDFDLWVRIALQHKVAFLNVPSSYYNQDVDIVNRATRHLHSPKHHMLFNLEYLEPYERENEDYKRMIDKLRVSGLLDYHLSKEYREIADKELAKVDWTRQPKSVKRQYATPAIFLKGKQLFMRYGSKVKQALIKKGLSI